MSQSDIAGTVTTTVVIDGVTYAENLTVDPTGSVVPVTGDGIDTSSLLPDADVANVFLDNSGTITAGAGAIGVDWTRGNQVTNGGTISGGASSTGSGGAGVDVSATTPAGSMESYGSVTNGGSIDGGNGLTIGGDGVIVNSGASLTNGFVGDIQGGTAATGGAGAAVYGFMENDNSLTGGNGTTAGGVGVIIDGGYVENGGTIMGGAGGGGSAAAVDLTDGGTLYNYGTIGSEALTAARPATQVQPLDASSDVAVEFGAGANTLEVQAGSPINGAISGFTSADQVEVFGTTGATIDSSTATSASITYTTASGSETLTFLGSFGSEQFGLTTDAYGDVTITLQPACYLRGTRIRTPAGDVPIESLRIGDAVVTVEGAVRAIRWIGRRTYPAAFVAGHRDVLPVRIRAGALGAGLPVRDLYLSPEHALWIDGLLIPARALLNGRSIEQPAAAGEVAYLHLEFETQEVILAEGAAAESYIDDESRGMFDNAAEFHALYPEAARQTPARFCGPRVEDGFELERIRRRLAALNHDARIAAPAGCELA